MIETKRAPSATPKDIADRWEYTVSTLAKQLQAKRAQIKQTIGARPYRGVPLTKPSCCGDTHRLGTIP